MSGTFPASPAPATMLLSSLQPTLVSTSHSLKRQVRSRGGQRWGVKLDYRNRSRAQMAPLIAFALAQRGQFGSFTFVVPVLGVPQGTAANGSTTAITASGRAVPATLDGTLKAGDLIKFNGHSKVYMLTADAPAGASTLAIEPGLLSGVANGEAITCVDVPMTCAFASDSHEVAFAERVYQWSCELVETW